MISVGKFCNWFGPVWKPGLLKFTPELPRSIPRPPLPRIELPRIGFDTTPCWKLKLPTWTPAAALKAITLASPGAVPPIWLPVELTRIPAPPLGSPVVPVMSVPTRLPTTTLPAGRPLLNAVKTTPVPPLPEIRLPAAPVRPPIVNCRALFSRMPPLELPSGEAPVTSVPMKFSAIVPPVAPSTSIP